MSRSSLKNVIAMLDSVTEDVSAEQSFLIDLKRSIEMTADNDDYVASKTYKPSGMNCMRQSYYVITGAKEDKKSNSYISVGICNSGSDIHERIQTAISQMKDNDIDCEYVDVGEFVKSRNLTDIEVVKKQGMETKLYHKKYNMSFLCDGIIKYKNHYYILELKTETTNKFWNRNNVDKAHHKQATAYSLAFGIDEVIFIYINRDMLDMKAFMLNVTDEMKQDLIGYIDTCDNYIKQMKVPPIEDIDTKKCSYCSFKNQCRKDG